MENRMHPIVIIGSGMAGYAVAREFRKLNPDHELVMICADDATNYAKPTLSNALAGNKAPEPTWRNARPSMNYIPSESERQKNPRGFSVRRRITRIV